MGKCQYFFEKNEKNFSKNFSPADEEYSISPTAEAEEKNSAYPSTFGKADTMEEFTANVERAYSDATKDANPKALNYLKRQENDFASRLCSALSVPYRVGRELVKPYVRALIAEYMQTGEISEDSFGQLWREAIRRIEEDFERGQNSISELKEGAKHSISQITPGMTDEERETIIRKKAS